jgi:hypothetical protein
LFNPLRRRVQRFVDRRFNRARYDAELAVAAFAGRLKDAVDLGTVRARPSCGVRAETWQGICLVARDPYLRPLTSYAAVANLAYTGNLALVVIFLIRVVGLSSAAAGLLMGTGGIGGLSGLLIPLTGRGPRLGC